MWYETTPTVWSAGGTITYINWDEKRRAEMRKNAALLPWIDRAEARGEFIVVATRQAAVRLAAELDAKALADANLKAETLNVAPPAAGTNEEKDTAVQVKLTTVITPAEYDKLTAAVAALLERSLPTSAEPRSA